jgi:2-dehydropantoate 2-reductase
VRHAVLGVGGIGGLVGAALGRAGREVLLLLRPATLAAYPGRLSVESAVLGDFEVEVPAAVALERDVDVLWVATKATQLESALDAAPPGHARTVVPLLNGVDHVALLRERYPHVVAATIAVESERTGWTIRQPSPFLRVAVTEPEIAAEVTAAGIECTTNADEPTLLWAKLTLLAPVALATTALDAPVGGVRADDRYVRSREEAFAVARAEGARVDEETVRAAAAAMPDGMRSSMQKDVDAGRAPELEAIAGPILRGGRRHGIPVPAAEELAGLVAARSSERAARA